MKRTCHYDAFNACADVLSESQLTSQSSQEVLTALMANWKMLRLENIIIIAHHASLGINNKKKKLNPRLRCLIYYDVSFLKGDCMVIAH